MAAVCRSTRTASHNCIRATRAGIHRRWLLDDAPFGESRRDSYRYSPLMLPKIADCGWPGTGALGVGHAHSTIRRFHSQSGTGCRVARRPSGASCDRNIPGSGTMLEIPVR